MLNFILWAIGIILLLSILFFGIVYLVAYSLSNALKTGLDKTFSSIFRGR